MTKEQEAIAHIVMESADQVKWELWEQWAEVSLIELVSIVLARIDADRAAALSVVGYAMLRSGEVVGLERTVRQAKSWVGAERIPLTIDRRLPGVCPASADSMPATICRHPLTEVQKEIENV